MASLPLGLGLGLGLGLVEELLALATAHTARQLRRLVGALVLDRDVRPDALEQLADFGGGAERGDEQGRPLVDVAGLEVLEARLLLDQVLEHLR